MTQPTSSAANLAPQSTATQTQASNTATGLGFGVIRYAGNNPQLMATNSARVNITTSSEFPYGTVHARGVTCPPQIRMAQDGSLQQVECHLTTNGHLHSSTETRDIRPNPLPPQATQVIKCFAYNNIASINQAAPNDPPIPANYIEDTHYPLNTPINPIWMQGNVPQTDGGLIHHSLRQTPNELIHRQHKQIQLLPSHNPIEPGAFALHQAIEYAPAATSQAQAIPAAPAPTAPAPTLQALAQQQAQLRAQAIHALHRQAAPTTAAQVPKKTSVRYKSYPLHQYECEIIEREKVRASTIEATHSLLQANSSQLVSVPVHWELLALDQRRAYVFAIKDAYLKGATIREICCAFGITYPNFYALFWLGAYDEASLQAADRARALRERGSTLEITLPPGMLTLRALLTQMAQNFTSENQRVSQAAAMLTAQQQQLIQEEQAGLYDPQAANPYRVTGLNLNYQVTTSLLAPPPRRRPAPEPDDAPPRLRLRFSPPSQEEQ